MLKKETFVNAIQAILQQEKQVDRLNAIYREMTHELGFLAVSSLVQDALIKTLKDGTEDQNDWIEWWLYEAPKDDKNVFWVEDGKHIEADLSEPGALYDFLVQCADERRNKCEDGQKNQTGRGVP